MYAVRVEEYSNNYVSEYVRGERSPIFNWTEGMAGKYITCIYGANLQVVHYMCQIAKRPVRLTSTVKCTLIYPPGIYVVANTGSCIYIVYKHASMQGMYIGRMTVYQFNDTCQCSWIGGYARFADEVPRIFGANFSNFPSRRGLV